MLLYGIGKTKRKERRRGMIDKENIKNIVELFIAWNGEAEAIDVANLDSAVDFIADSLQEESVWKPADGDDLPEIDREVIALTQPYPNDEHLRVVFAHRPNKYAKVWNSNLDEEQVVEIERYDKGGWNIPDVKWWLDVELPKEK